MGEKEVSGILLPMQFVEDDLVGRQKSWLMLGVTFSSGGPCGLKSLAVFVYVSHTWVWRRLPTSSPLIRPHNQDVTSFLPIYMSGFCHPLLFPDRILQARGKKARSIDCGCITTLPISL